MTFKFKFLSLFLILTLFSITGALSQSPATAPGQQIATSQNSMAAPTCPLLIINSITSPCLQGSRVVQVTLNTASASYYGQRYMRFWYKKTNTSTWAYVRLTGTANPYTLRLSTPGNYQMAVTTDNATTPFQAINSQVHSFTIPTEPCMIIGPPVDHTPTNGSSGRN